MTEPLIPAGPLPIGGEGSRSAGWWGVWGLIASEGALFAYLLFTYFYAAVNSADKWPPDGPPDLKTASISTVTLLSTSLTIWLAEKQIEKSQSLRAAGFLGLTLALGCLFTGLQILEWSNKSFTPASHTYGSIFFLITSLHLAHVVVGLCVIGFLLVWTWKAYFNAAQHNVLTIGALYWHFVDAVWIFIYASLYLSPHLGVGHGI